MDCAEDSSQYTLCREYSRISGELSAELASDDPSSLETEIIENNIDLSCSSSGALSTTGVLSLQRFVSRTPGVYFHGMWISVVGIMLLVVPPGSGFNVDIQKAIVHSGENGSMFGYSVAQHIDQSTNWLLVGAPRAETSQPGVTRGGAVYRCKTDRPSVCRERIPFDDTGNNIKYFQRLNKYLPVEEKSNQWFGSTVKSSGENGVIVACAPRYVYFSELLDKQEPVGVCYLAKTSTTKYEKYLPCSAAVDRSDIIDQYHRQGYCQAGFSAAFSSTCGVFTDKVTAKQGSVLPFLQYDGRRLLIGAPGSWYWQGQVFNYKTEEGGKVFSSTPEGQPEADDTYMGYASAIGEFDGDSNDDYIVGTPKGEYHLGKVDIFNQNLTIIGSLFGEQIGAYFGSSLAVADLNGDRMDDIIVGAPMYADVDASDVYDTGRVYIYYQTSNVNAEGKNQRTFPVQTRDILDGQSSNSRFGMSMTGLGDINYDGYDDLCVGAPYAGEDNKGAVYLYHGSKKGIITEVSQVIYAKDIDTTLSTFGISVSGGLDQDGNSYPDLLVGAYASDKAVFLRTRPVVRVFASLKLQPEMINLDTKSCSLADGTRVPCLTIYTCVEFNGVGVPDELFFDISWVLDVKDNNSSGQEQRAYYTNSINKFTESKLHKLQKQNTFCTSSFAYVKNDPGDKLSPIRVTMEFKLNTEGTSQRKQDLLPILDAYIPTITSFTAQIQKDCGSDNICIPDLDVSSSIRVSAEHIIGSTTSLEMLIIVINRGEDSFNTKLWVELPPGVTYNTITNQRSSIAISCTALKSDNTKVSCDLGNPMQRTTESAFTMVFTPTNTNDTKDWLVFNLNANSTNPEQAGDYDNNFARIEIPVIVVPEIALFGRATPALIVLKTAEEKGEEDVRLVKLLFQLINQGLSATNETEFQIKLPNYDVDGNPILMMHPEIKVEGHGKCKIIIITANNATSYTGLVSSGTKSFRDDGDRGRRPSDMQTITCSDKYCTIIQCLVGYMAPYKSFVLTIESRLMARSFIQRREATKMYHITSIAHARVRSVPYAFDTVNLSKFEVKRLELVITINTDQLKPASKDVEMWVIAVSVTAGLLMLFLLILLLWWCGFFKRKKHIEEGYYVANGKTDIDHKIVD